MRFRSLASALIGLASLLACEPVSLPGPSGAAAGSAAAPLYATSERADSGPAGRQGASERDPSLVSLDTEEAMQVYYQFTDERGRVRFVSTLMDVPPEWRDRVGFVEMSSPPPMSPADARRIRSTQMAKLPSRPPDARFGAAGADEVGSRRGPEIIMYSADWCGACRKAKRYMNGEGIDFIERDVDDPDWKAEMLAKAGPGGIPVFDVEGQILRGFSAQRLQQLIREAS